MLLEKETAIGIGDAYPLTPGPSRVILRRHRCDGLLLHQPEWTVVVEPLKRRREPLKAKDSLRRHHPELPDRQAGTRPWLGKASSTTDTHQT